MSVGPEWLYHPLGVCSSGATYIACRSYNFWSGIGSDLGEITLLGIAIGMFRHVNCHAPWCPRLGKHPTADGQFRLCRHHHPDLPDAKLSLEQIVERHRKASNDPDC